MSENVQSCVSAVLDDRSLSCLAHPNAEAGCWTRHHPPLCTACQNAATEKQSISLFPPLCRICEDLDGYIARESGTHPVVLRHCDAALMAAARVQAERRFPGLWAAAAQVETPTPVTLAARPGFGISWDSWRIAIGDPYRARVAEFTEWLSVLDPDGVSQRAATMARVDDLIARARVADVYLRIRIVEDVWLRDVRRGVEVARPVLDRTAEGSRALRALDNCESLVGGVRSVLEPFDVRTLVEDMF